jgi:hypothetical protein
MVAAADQVARNILLLQHGTSRATIITCRQQPTSSNAQERCLQLLRFLSHFIAKQGVASSSAAQCCAPPDYYQYHKH